MPRRRENEPYFQTNAFFLDLKKQVEEGSVTLMEALVKAWSAGEMKQRLESVAEYEAFLDQMKGGQP